MFTWLAQATSAATGSASREAATSAPAAGHNDPIPPILGLSVNQWVLIVAGIALVFAIRRWRQITVKKTLTAPSSSGQEQVVARSVLTTREVTAELVALLADLEETSRRLTAQLDNRTQRLEQLLEEADEKIRRLEALNGKAAEPAPAANEKTHSTMERSPAHQSAIGVLTEAQRTLQRLREERGAPAPKDDPAYQPIYSLADRGKSSREIAQELGRQPGEIELILALRFRA